MAVVGEEQCRVDTVPARDAAQERLWPALAGAPVLAVLAAIAVVAVDGIVAFYDGSYLSWSIAGLVAAFWTVAAITAGVLVSLAAVRRCLVVKGPAAARHCDVGDSGDRLLPPRAGNQTRHRCRGPRRRGSASRREVPCGMGRTPRRALRSRYCKGARRLLADGVVRVAPSSYSAV